MDCRKVTEIFVLLTCNEGLNQDWKELTRRLTRQYQMARHTNCFVRISFPNSFKTSIEVLDVFCCFIKV